MRCHHQHRGKRSSPFEQSGRNGHRYDEAVPELPEMQALSERLDDAFGGARVERVMPLQFSALKTVAPMYDTLNGQRLTGVERRGKFLVMELERARLVGARVW